MMKTIRGFSRAKISVLVFMAISAFIAFPFRISAAEILVTDFASLKNAVMTASDSDSIVIGNSFALQETLIVDKSLTFKAPSEVALTVSGNFRHMDVRAYNGGDITLEFVNVGLIGRKTSPDDTTSGGGIVITRTSPNTIHTLHLVNAVIQNCHSGSYGGGIAFTWPPGQAVIDDCNLEISGSKADIGNNSASRGGGISANRITVNGGVIHNNTATVWAGGIYAYGGLTMNAGAISGNTAGSYGGGSANYHGDYIINGGTISRNRAGGAGGGVYAAYKLTINGGNIENNGTDGSGGGLSADTAEINGGKISGNAAALYGGGLTSFMETKMSAGEITGNTAGQDGGGILAYYFEGYSKDTAIAGGHIGGNSAAGNGGGIYAGGGISVAGAMLDRNISGQNGGGLYADNGNVRVTGSSVSGNTAGQDGGGIWVADLSRLVTDSVTLRDNKAHEGYIWNINNPSDEEQAADALTHQSHILATTYTAPFTNAYSNYDVNYASGIPLGEYVAPGSGEVPRVLRGSPNTGAGIFVNEPNLESFGTFYAEEILPPPPITEERPMPEPNPNTGSPDRFALTAALLLCAGAVCLAGSGKNR